MSIRVQILVEQEVLHYRYTASYFDGVAMRDNAYRNRYVKKK